MSRFTDTLVVPVLALALAGACTSSPSADALGPTAPGAQAAKRSDPPQGTLVADFMLDVAFGYVSEPLVSTCPGAVGDGYHVAFGDSGCLEFTPTGSDYALTDDILMWNPGLKKDGRITRVRFVAQDVAGPDGIKHDTDEIPVAVPVVPDPAGFTLHVHADNVPVYRLSGHTGGKRVAMIGTISVWDIVYREP
jgi:hypothetical protein